MTKHRYLPLCIADWTTDTNHLNHCERGLYLDILILMWRTPDCRVPNDMAWLSKRLRTNPDDIKRLIEEFCDCDGNWITQKRLSKEYDFVTKAHEVRSVAAKRRWDKEKASHNAHAPHFTSLHLTSLHNTSIKKGKKEEESADERFDRFWVAYPRHVGKPLARKAFQTAIRKTSLEEM